MTASPPPGHSRAGSPAPDSRGNGVRSNDYGASHASDVPDDVNSYDTELVTSPGHGAVGVFQAPQPVRPRTNGSQPTGAPAVDPSLDIDSPFLDLFGGAPAPAPASRPTTRDTDEDDFDFGFDFDDRPARPTSPPAAPVSAQPFPDAAQPFPDAAQPV